MSPRAFIVLLLLVLLPTFPAPAAEPPKMVLRMYPIQPSFTDVVFERTEPAKEGGAGEFITMGTAPTPKGRTDLDMRKFFEDAGVPFPPGSYIYYNRGISALLMFNTEENHRLLAQVLVTLNVVPVMLELDASFVVFDRREIEDAARKSASAAPSGEQIKELWRAGKGHLLGTQKVICRSGVNAQIQSVTERLYPTEFEGVGPERVSGSNTAAAAWFVLPGSFETREEGFLFNVTPTLGYDGRTIDLVLQPELCEGGVWDDVRVLLGTAGGKTIESHFPQPAFHSRNVSTTIVITDGETVIMGGLPNRQGEQWMYFFFTARCVDSAGRPLKNFAGLPFFEESATTNKVGPGGAR